ncbi:hypothetical protein Syun_027876 [Stephania yunnanensis]|uniref:Uncharacterized protein n=1 Tax=Stephania yunnanensis TaxID=152371 RepID=A0AAP0EGC4_9MAGN
MYILSLLPFISHSSLSLLSRASNQTLPTATLSPSLPSDHHCPHPASRSYRSHRLPATPSPSRQSVSLFCSSRSSISSLTVTRRPHHPTPHPQLSPSLSLVVPHHPN